MLTRVGKGETDPGAVEKLTVQNLLDDLLLDYRVSKFSTVDDCESRVRLHLSPAFGRKTIAISIHEAAETPYENYFADAQAVFLNHGGRPHWGKIHYCSVDQLRAFYPEWEAFWDMRRRIDPGGIFLNDYMRKLSGESI